MRITFLGGVGTVTGSKYLVEDEDTCVMVDCGLFQGPKNFRLQNWAAFPVPIEKIQAIILTHAHIDHSGYIPVLVKRGFKGPIYCSEPTRDLCQILLPDCGRIHEEDAAYANKKGSSKHHPALPLYDESDANVALRQFKGIAIGQKVQIGSLQFMMQPVGHILGACQVLLKSKHRSILFSGDLGRYDDLIEKPPADPLPAPCVLVESTYGDRRHPKDDPFKALAYYVRQVIERRSVLLTPVFAVGRLQSLLFALEEVFSRGLAPRIKVYVNSPMGTNVTAVYRRYSGWHKLSEAKCAAIEQMAHFVSSPEESRALNEKKGPMIILSASGMLTGGRILHHIKRFGPHEENIILLAGFQAPGTRGASLVDGAKALKIYGEMVPINAEVVKLDLFSAHADQAGVVDWLSKVPFPPHKVFIVHGEPSAAEAMARAIEEKHGFKTHIPTPLETVDLT